MPQDSDPSSPPKHPSDPGDQHQPTEPDPLHPQEGHAPVPMWMVIFAGCLLLWAGWYLAVYNGQWRADVLDPQPTIPNSSSPLNTSHARPSSPTVAVDPLVLGQRLYMGYCAACHQPHGKGVPKQYPPLAQSEWVQGPPDRLARILLHGLEGPIQVKGVNYRAVMPPIGPRMNDQQMAAVLTYIRQAWGNQSPAVEPELVKSIRQKERQRYLPWKAQELLDLPPDIPPESPEAPPKNSGPPKTLDFGPKTLDLPAP